MSALITFIVFAITLIPALLIGILMAPLGLADNWGHTYENWLTDAVCNCREVEK